MRVCYVASECVPYAKTGGLADVSGTLPKVLSKLGVETKIFLPLYGSISQLDFDLTQDPAFNATQVHLGTYSKPFSLWRGTLPDADVEVNFIDCPYFFNRTKLYTNDADEADRFIYFQRAVLNVLQTLQWAPDVFHCNDWQTALIPVFLKTAFSWDNLFKKTGSLLSIHNIGYQGIFDPEKIYNAGLPFHYYYPTGPFEFYNSFCFLKSGIHFADKISTVSEKYAEEIQFAEHGAGLHGVLASRKNDIHGILNGIDRNIWSPSIDRHIFATYDAKTLAKKLENKKNLLQAVNLPFDKKIPLFGIVSRLAIQKGFDIFQPVFEAILEKGVQFIILGSGEPEYEDFLRWISHRYENQVSVHIGFNESLAHKITAGADIFLMPSHYEPCGLNQMYSLNYGTVPIVRETGGLADTVTDVTEHPDIGNGFVFQEYSSDALLNTAYRAIDTFTNQTVWKKMQKRGMLTDFSWDASARKYVELYENII